MGDTKQTQKCNNVAKCGACAKFVGRTGSATCSKCGSQFHNGCVALPTDTVVPKGWICPICQSALPRDNRPDTPVKGLPAAVRASATPPAATPPAATQSTVAEFLCAPGPGSSLAQGGEQIALSLLQLEQLVRDEVGAVRQELKEFREEFRDVRAQISGFNLRMGKLEGRVDAIEKQVADGAASTATKALEEAVANLQMELNDREQELLANDVQVSNVPEEPGESAAGLATRIGARLGVELDVRDVVSVHRAGRAREAGRPRPLVLRLARRAVRDELLQGARTRRGATTDGLGLASAPQRFYVNERLTGANRQLFQRAREAARAAAWRYIWTRDGKIFARRSDGQPSVRLRRLTDLDIFKAVVAEQTSP